MSKWHIRIIILTTYITLTYTNAFCLTTERDQNGDIFDEYKKDLFLDSMVCTWPDSLPLPPTLITSNGKSSFECHPEVAFMKYIQTIYASMPQEVKTIENHAFGTLHLSLFIDKYGRMIDVRRLNNKGSDTVFDITFKELLLNEPQTWQPAIHNGKNVNFRWNLKLFVDPNR